MRKVSYDANSIGELIIDSKAEMSGQEHRFILWCLREFRPRKILEVGVGSGGTSALILKNTDEDQCLWSVDIASHLWNNNTLSTGYRVHELGLDSERHKLLTGKDVLEQMEVVGGSIDLCVLDTRHSLPGELLQFLGIYKYMSPRSLLVMHDLSLNFNVDPNQKINHRKYSFATRVLFSVIGSHLKLLPDIPLPNIGAVRIDDKTRASIPSIFFALGITWNYYPGHILAMYRDFFAKNYDSFCLNVFDQCVARQKLMVESAC